MKRRKTSDTVHDRLRPELKSLKAYAVPAKAPPIKLDANESPFNLPASVRAELGRVVAEASYNRYPDGRALELRAALSTYLDVDGAQLLLGVGSDEIISMAMNALSTPMPKMMAAVVAYPDPSFVMYGVTSHAHGLRPLPVPLDSRFHFDEDAMRNALGKERPAIAFYATPNNPTGRPIDDDVLRRIIEAFPGTLHVIDEAYGPFEREVDGAAKTRRGWVDEFPQVAVMGTLSKVGLAGLRVGYLHASQVLIDELEKVRGPFNLNTPSQVIATQLLTHHSDLLEANVRTIVAERHRMFDALSALKLSPIPSMANFVLAQISTEMGQALRAGGIGVRVFRDASLQGWARITVGTPAENDALFAALRSLV